MAGLLDIFGTGGADTLGLLGMSQADIQSARDDAQAQALYGLAGRLFQGGNTGASIAQGLQQGQQLYKQAMQGQLQEQMTMAQLQELQRKKKEEALAKALFMQGYKPAQAAVLGQEVYGEDIMGQQVGEGVVGAKPAQAARFDLAGVAPQLMALGSTGQAYLKNALDMQKAMGGDLTKVGPEEQLIRFNPLTQQTEVVASGAPKVAKLTGKEGNAALMFYGTDDVSQLRNIPGAVDKIRVEATTQRKAEQPQINLADPTAVQTQQLKTINQWEGVLKDSGAAETAMRAQGFYSAYEQAKKGNTNADGAMIYNVAKVYDPAGAVQAGDVSTVLGSRSVPENIKSYAQKLTTGGTLTPKERDNMKKIIDTVVEERKKMIEPSLGTYRGINKRLGGDDSSINNPFDMVKQPKSLEEILGLRPRGGK